MHDFWNGHSSRGAAILALAGFGFVALIGSGMWLAIYLSQYVPNAVGAIGAAAVSLYQTFSPAPSIPPSSIASTTLPFIEATSTAAEAATSTATSTAAAPAAPARPAVPQPGKKTSETYPLGGSGASLTLSGLPDLQVSITAVGYLATSSADSFIATTTVPKLDRPAIKFTVKNIGTNKTGPWNFIALIPTQTNYLFQSPSQQSLNPGESIEYTLGFDQANSGANQTITVSANSDRTFKESNFDNNKASVTVTILGS